MDPYPFIACTPKLLPAEKRIEAAKVAIDRNPANAPMRQIATPERIAGLTKKLWSPKGHKFGVSFLDTTDGGLIDRIIKYMNKWNAYANVSFAWSQSGGEIRIARTEGDGYYSYVGTDILSIPAGQPTMNLDSFTLLTPLSEYDRVVTHETGHSLGFPHEHQRAEEIAMLEAEKVIAWLAQADGWDRQTVIEQVLTPIDPATLFNPTPLDIKSIMNYEFPGSVTKSGQPIPGGLFINATDGAYAGKLYPLAITPTKPPTGGTDGPFRVAVSTTIDYPAGGPVVGTLGKVISTSKIVTAPASAEDVRKVATFFNIALIAEIEDYLNKFETIVAPIVYGDLLEVVLGKKTLAQVLEDIKAALRASGDVNDL